MTKTPDDHYNQGYYDAAEFFARRIKWLMRQQFQVWSDTPNADDILEDTARSLGHHLFAISGYGNGLSDFVDECRHKTGKSGVPDHPDGDDYAERAEWKARP